MSTENKPPLLPVFRTVDNVVRLSQGHDISKMDIDKKMKKLTEWLSITRRRKTKYMLYMIMYDIENNKIRTHIAKYLIKKGCMRIQKSVYIAKGTSREMKEISQILYEINAAYANNDSIFVLPIPQEKFNNMKVIGKNMSFEIITKPKNVLIF